MKTIAVVEDDIEIGNAIEELLSLEGYCVKRAYSGTEALMLLAKERPDLVLLDLNLPGLNGEEVLPHIKNIPVIIVSAKTGVGDKVKNLFAGASDYITKPFDNDELLARIAVQLRQAAADNDDDILRWKNIELNRKTYSVTAAGFAVKLTKTEFAILQLFVANPKNVFSKGAIAEKISDFTADGGESSISVHISSLRHKLSAAASQDYIETVWGIGFKLIP